MKKLIATTLILTLLVGCAAPAAVSPMPPIELSPVPTEEATPSPAPAEPAHTPDRGDLTEEQVEQVNRAFMAYEETGTIIVEREVNGFFTSYYADVRELDFAEFLWYYPSDGDLGEEDLEEFAALAELPDFHWEKAYFAESGLTPSRLPVPTHRILRASVDETLRKYAGITTADLKHIEGTLYLKDYDAYYVFTSDFGPGSFTCEGGRVEGDTAVLWSGELYGEGIRDELTLEKQGENWYIRSFLRGLTDRKKALNSWLLGLDAGEIERVEGIAEEHKPSVEDLAEMLRSAAQTPGAYWRYNDTIWSMTVSLTNGRTLSVGAGKEKDVVSVSRGGEREYLVSPELYQLIRTGMDTEKVINTFWYEKCRDMVDDYYNARLEELRETGYVSWELTEFAGVIGTSKVENEGITVFRVNAAFRTDPPELAAQRIAGGAYVDSELRVHGLDWYPVHLVTIDGEAVGLTFDNWLERYPGQDPLDHYTEAEIREMVANAHRKG